MTKKEIIEAVLHTPIKYHYMTYDEMEMCTKKDLMRYYEDIKRKEAEDLASAQDVDEQLMHMKVKYSGGVTPVEVFLIQSGRSDLLDDIKKEEEYRKKIDNIYPLTILCDRYGGLYSGGKYTAWKLEYWLIPEEVDGGDCECDGFWNEYDREPTLRFKYPVGFGETIEAALRDLVNNLEEQL